MADLFGRSWALTVGDRQWTDLRVTFECKRSLNKHPDPAQITVYNLAAQTRASFDGGEQVRLVAGYLGAAGLVYSGTLVDVATQRDGPDRATTIVCRDGSAAWDATVRHAFSANAPLSLVVGRLVSAMGLQLAAGSGSLLTGKTTRGNLVQVGYAQAGLEGVLAPFGLRFMLQDGAVVVLPSDGATAEDAVLLSPDTGLIGSPEPMTHGKKLAGKKVRKLRLTSLLQSSIRPGRRVQLVSESFSGVYRADKVLHRGDTHGQDWYTIAECTALGGA